MLPRVPIGHGFPDPHPLLKRTAFGALVGGDMSGSERGQYAVDLQTTHSAASEIASGLRSVALGTNNTASGQDSVCAGYSNVASQAGNVAIGYNNDATGNGAFAFGRNCSVTGALGVAFGQTCIVGTSYNGVAIGVSCSAYDTFNSVALGVSCTMSGGYGIAAGYSCTASAAASVAVGAQNTASAAYASVFGVGCSATAQKTAAFGYGAVARITTTTVVNGPIIVRKDNGEAANLAFLKYCGVEVVLFSKEVSLKTVADQTLTLPAGCHFWLNEIGVECTSLTALTTQPAVRFGITGSLAKHRAGALTTLLTAAYKRDKFTPLVPEDGETSLTAGVVVAAVATTMLGRFYWKGLLVEDE